jgi:hypothetical protein
MRTSKFTPERMVQLLRQGESNTAPLQVDATQTTVGREAPRHWRLDVCESVG